MNRVRSFVFSAALLLGTASAGHAQADGTIRAMLFAGTQNTPTAFDVFRSVEYDVGVHVGGGLIVDIDERVAVRGSFGLATNSGSETGALAGEAVDFSRRYFAAELQVKFPVTSLTPYVLGGGGLVSVSRVSPSYSYDATEGAAVFGAGVSYPIGSSIELFTEGKGWIYSRQTIGETQFDKVLNVGLTYTLPI